MFLRALEEITSGEYPDPEAPQEAISLNFYADHLHWDKEKAAIIAEREKDAFEGPQTRLFFLQAAFGMTHLYIGYSLLIGAALGEGELS